MSDSGNFQIFNESSTLSILDLCDEKPTFAGKIKAGVVIAAVWEWILENWLKIRAA